MTETKAPEGLAFADLDAKLFSKIAEGCGLKLKSWRQVVNEDSSEDNMTSIIANAADGVKDLEGFLTGISYFEITGTSLKQKNGCEVKVKVVFKVKMTPNQTAMSIAEVFATPYEKSEEEILELFSPLTSRAYNSAKEIEVARW